MCLRLPSPGRVELCIENMKKVAAQVHGRVRRFIGKEVMSPDIVLMVQPLKVIRVKDVLKNTLPYARISSDLLRV